MPSGQYTIDDSSTSRGDTSFRACVIALLIFLLFCVTIIIILLVVKKDAGAGVAAESGDGGTASEHTGDESEKEDRRSGTEATPSPGGRTTAATSTVPSSSEEAARSDATDDRSASESKHVKTLAGHSSSTEHSTRNLTTTEGPSKTPTNDSTEGSDSEARGVEPMGDLPRTSTEPPTATDGERSAPEEGAPEEPPAIPTTPSPPATPVPCATPECRRLGAHVLATMGPSAEPCKHFYEFACGGLRGNKYLLEPDYEEEAWQRIGGEVDNINASSPESFHKFKRLIQSCQTYDPVKDISTWKDEVLKEINDLGRIAVEEAEFTENFTRLFLGLLQHDRPFIFEVTLDINDTAPQKFAVKMFPASMMENQLYPEDNGALECQAKAVAKLQNLNDIYSETLNCMKTDIGRTKAYEVAKEALMTLGILSTTDEAEKLNQTLKDYVDFLVLNNEALGEKAARRLELQNREPELLTVKALNEMFQSSLKVDWSAIIEKLVGRPLADDERVQVYSDKYFLELNKKFSEIKSRWQLHNAAVVAFAAARYRDLVAEQRWRPHVFPTHCTRLAARLLPDAAAALYLRSFTEARRDQLQTEAENLRFELTSTFLRELDRAPWLDQDATKGLKEELAYKVEWIQDTRNITNHTSDVMDTDKLDAALKDYTIEAGFIKNAITLMARNRERLYKRIDEEPINNIWTHFIHPYDTTGISLYSLNFIAIPLGAIEKPFYDPDYLRHLRLAGLGFSVANQMMHHIDSLGIKFIPKIDERTKEDYNAIIPRFPVFRTEVQVEYLNITGSDKHKNVQFKFRESDLKDKEVFADKIAIQLAYKTYNKTRKESDTILPYLPLTNDQSFFVFLAQKFCTKLDFFSMVLDFFESPHFPPETRVRNMIEYNAAFNKAFNCKVTEKTDFPFPYIDVPEPDVDGA